MALSKDLISQFVKATNDNKDQVEETTLYGTIVENGGVRYVRLDGSELLTPYTSIVAVNVGERVRVSVGKHTAVVTGNVSSPAARSGDVDDLNKKVTEFENVVADKATIKDLEVQKGRIDDLVADNITIKKQLTADSADIKDLKADNVEIKGTLQANSAEIDNLKSTKIDAEVVEANYATIKNLSAATADIRDLKAKNAEVTGRLEANEVDIKNLKSDTAEISRLVAGKVDVIDFNAEKGRINSLEVKQTQTDELVAKKADIDLANVNNAWIQNGIIKDGSIGSAAIHDGAITNVKIADASIEAAKIKSINADTITAGTIKTDRLIITGPDGEDSIVKAINLANGVSEADVNSQKIQAASIDVIDLSAFKAKIAGFDMNGNAIYSGKESIKDPTSGIYISTTGIGMGDGALTGKNESPLQAYADGSFKLIGKNSFFDFNTVTRELNIEASSFKVASKSVATKDDIDDVRDEITTFLSIESSKGTAFKNNSVSTILSVIIYHGKDRVEDPERMREVFGFSAYLQWYWRRLDDEAYGVISSTDSRLRNEGFQFVLSPDDVDVKTDFRCELIA